MNGYVPSLSPHDIDNGDDVTVCDVTSVYRRHNFRSSAPTTSNGQSSSESAPTLPHIVAYYEIESTKPFPKEARRSGGGNLGVEQLRAAIVRLTKGVEGDESGEGDLTTVPVSWWRFARHLATVADTDLSQPCLPLYDVIAIARSFDVAPRDARLALRHYARRGRVWIGDGGRRCSTSLVVVHPPWIVETIGRVIEAVENSVVFEQDLLNCLTDSDVERQLAKASRGETITPASSARWLLAVLENLGVCAPLASSRAFLFPVLLETGSPSDDVWPETPDWNEKQVTCEIPLRRTRPGQFADLQVKLGGPQGLRQIAVLQHPVPIFFRHHVIFTTAYDAGPCEDCFRFSRRYRSAAGPATGSQQQRSSAAVDNVTCRSTITAVDGHPVPPAEGSSVASSAAAVAVVHRVHISLDCHVRSLSVQVRGSSPCCVMHAVIDFIDCYLDDDPAVPSPLSTSAGVDSCSVKTTDHILTNGTTLSVSSSKSAWRSRASTISAYRASYCESRDSVNGDTSLPPDDDEDGGGGGGDVDAINSFNSDETRRRIYVVCPKCILMRNVRPERMEYPWSFCGSAGGSSSLRRRRPICSKWHNLGSWARVITGDYRVTALGLDATVPAVVGGARAGSNTLSDYDHPRLVVVLPSSAQRAAADWYTACQTQFLEGYEARFLCEYTGYWHVVDDAAYRFTATTPPTSSAAVRRRRRPGDHLLAAVLRLALPVIQCLNAVDDHPENARLLAPVITELVDSYDVMIAVDGYHQVDPCAWLTRYKDRIVSVLTKVQYYY